MSFHHMVPYDMSIFKKNLIPKGIYIWRKTLYDQIYKILLCANNIKHIL